jgi:hypothetical protein
MMDWSESLVFFSGLEGGVCTTCAPGDQRKSNDNQCKQAELNALRYQPQADLSGQLPKIQVT